MQRVRYGFDTGVNRAYGASVRFPAEEVDDMFAGKGSIAGQIFFEDGGLGRKNGRMDEKKRGICLEVREIVRIFAVVK